MPEILVVADEPWVVNDVRAALADRRYVLRHIDDPYRVADEVAADPPDVVLTDMQVSSMGGMAVARAVRNALPDGQAPPVVVLLDRDADAFLAGRSGADAWVRKPFGASALRRAIDSVAAEAS